MLDIYVWIAAVVGVLLALLCCYLSLVYLLNKRFTELGYSQREILLKMGNSDRDSVATASLLRSGSTRT